MGCYGRQMIFIAQLDFMECLLDRILNGIRVLKVDGFRNGVKQLPVMAPLGNKY